MSSIVSCIITIVAIFEIVGIFTTLWSYPQIDFYEDYYMFKIICIPFFAAVDSNHELTVFGKILTILLDILWLPVHLLIAFIMFGAALIAGLCTKDKEEDEYYE